MIVVPPKHERERSLGPAEQYATLLEGFYRSLLDIGIPAYHARLVQRLERATGAAEVSKRRGLVVEPDERSREAATLLLRETGLDVAVCTRAKDALDYLRLRANDVAFAFVDETLAGERDGIELVEMITVLWPGIHLVLTTEADVDPPPGVVRIMKPWRAVELLAQVNEALRPTTLEL